MPNAEVARAEVRDNPEERRFEAWVDGQLAGFAEYRRTDTTVILPHTEVGDDFEGQGVGSVLARAALDAVRAEPHLRVVPRCAFIRSYIERHPEYADLVTRH